MSSGEEGDRLAPEIFVYATNKNFFNVYDALRIEKIKLEIAGYDQATGKQTGKAGAWLDVDDARLLCHLVTHRLFQEVLASAGHVPRFEKFGGSGHGDNVQSRILVVEWDPGEGNRFAGYPYRLSISNGPGTRTDKGAIQPKGEPTSKQSLRLPEAVLMKILLAVAAYIRAWEAQHDPAERVAQRRKSEERDAPREVTLVANITPIRAAPAPAAAGTVPAERRLDSDVEIDPTPCSPQQITEIVKGFETLGYDGETRRAWLTLYHVTAVKQLSAASATQLHRQLQDEYRKQHPAGGARRVAP